MTSNASWDTPLSHCAAHVAINIAGRRRASGAYAFHFPRHLAEFHREALPRCVLDAVHQLLELLGLVCASIPVRFRGPEDHRVRGLAHRLMVVEQPLEQAFARTEPRDLDGHVLSGTEPVQ